MGEDYTEDVPFYYDEDMRKVYDYETFPERYYGMSPAIAGVDDVALLAIVAVGCVLGAFGIHMASEDIGTFLVGSFKPWLEKRHPDKMSDFEIFLTGGAIFLIGVQKGKHFYTHLNIIILIRDIWKSVIIIMILNRMFFVFLFILLWMMN